jgi:hypothetical protein
MKIVAFVLATLAMMASPPLEAQKETPACSPVPTSFKLLQPHTIQELEATSLVELKNHAQHAPQVPFGFSNSRWEKFKSKYAEGDQIFGFQDPGTKGYIIIRGQCAVDIFIVSIV